MTGDPKDWVTACGYVAGWSQSTWVAFCNEYWNADARCTVGVATRADVEVVARRDAASVAHLHKLFGEEMDKGAVSTEYNTRLNTLLPAMTKHSGLSGEELWETLWELHESVRHIVQKLSDPGTALHVLCCRHCTVPPTQPVLLCLVSCLSQHCLQAAVMVR